MSNSRRGRPGDETPDQGDSQSGSQSPPQSGQQESEYGQTGSQHGQTEPQYGQSGSQSGQTGSQYRQTGSQASRGTTATEYRPAQTQPQASRSATATYREPGPRHREPEPPRKRPMWHYGLVALIGLIALGGLIALLVVNGRSALPHRAPPPPHSAAAPVGTPFVTRDALGNTYQVRLDRIIDPATGVGATPTSGNRLVGAVYTITGISGSPVGENAVTNASLVGANGHLYRATGARIDGYGNFNNSNISAPRGSSVTGAAAYQVPSGVKITQAQWAADAGRGAISRWTVP